MKVCFRRITPVLRIEETSRKWVDMATRVGSVLVMFAVLLAAVGCYEYGQVYCGRRLATSLALLCDDAPSVKRAGQGSGGIPWPWLERHLARSMGRSKRQVVSECCDKPCTVDELMSYCPYAMLY
ncbi:unnamed protein product, partial [Iphiclides podalirius]